MKFNIYMKLQDLMENEQAVKAFDEVLPGMSKAVGSNPQAQELSVEQLVCYTGIANQETILRQLNDRLEALNTPENAVSPREAKQMKTFQAMWKEECSRAAVEPCHSQDSIRPGEVWLDTAGKRIQAHGGGVFYEEGWYYWYGENKEYTDGKNGIWTWGIRVYRSRDLMNWENLGYLIEPVLDDPNAALFPSHHIDRPHVLKNEKTGKYVIWIKISGPNAAFTIWQADAFLGPYTMVKEDYRPNGYKAGDFDLVQDEKTGKAYLFFDKDHETMLGMELADDYLSAVREVSHSYSHLNPPFTREAPALFEQSGRKYMITSGMTGYVPNKSDAAVAASCEEEFCSLGNPSVQDPSNATFNSQISKIFRIEGTDRWIAMADRWLPEYKVDARIADLFTRTIAMRNDPEHYSATEAEVQEMLKANVLESANTSISDYVWLPIEWEDERPVLRWQEAWRPELF